MRKKMLSITTALCLVAGSVAGGQAIPVKAADVQISEATFGTETSVMVTARMADANKDNILSDAEAAKVKCISLLNDTADITPYAKYFPKLEEISVQVGNSQSLTINNSSIKKVTLITDNVVDLKGGSSVKEVTYQMTKKKGTVDFSKAKGYEKVTSFSISSGANITGVVLPNQNKLTYLAINGTKISKIDMAKYKNVSTMNLSNNQLKSINVKKNKKLVSLACYDNKLTSLNIASNTNLKDIGVGNNKLTKLDTSKNKKLTRVVAYSNKIKNYKTDSNKKLTQISMSNNKLTKLDITKNKNLGSLDISENNVKSVNVKKNTKLTSIYISGNKIKSIDLSKNKKLIALSVRDTKLKTLSLAKGAKLSSIHVGNNYNLLKKLNFNTKSYAGIYVDFPANKSYDLKKIIPALKKFTFSTTNDKLTIGEKGIFKMPAKKKGVYYSVTATKGKESAYISLNANY